MTALDLQKELLVDLSAEFAGRVFQKPREAVTAPLEYAALNFYAQALPVKSEDLQDYLPYILVQLSEGNQTDETGPEDVTVLINIGIFDDADDNRGHVGVMNLVEAIRQRLFERRTLAGKYFLTLPFKWKVAEEDVWPDFFAGIETHWNLPVILPADPNI